MTLTLVPNGGFETPGTYPWEADGWSFVVVGSIELYAGFDVGGYDVTLEGFEHGWNNDTFSSEFEPSDLEAAEFGEGLPITNEDFEGFEQGWSENEDWSDELVSTAAAVFDSSPEPVEDCEEEWSSNEDWDRYFSKPAFEVLDAAGSSLAAAGWYRVDLLGEDFDYYNPSATDVAIVAGALQDLIDASSLPVTTVLDGAMVVITPGPSSLDLALEVEGPVDRSIIIRTDWTNPDLDPAEFNTTEDEKEAFEREWGDNHNFLWDLGPTGTAQFDTTLEDFEDFEEEWPTERMQTIT